MADDKNKDLDPEEENNDPFEDDDFGLPDLEYDELEDDEEFDDEFDSPAFESEEDGSSDQEDDIFPQDESEELDEALTVEDTFGEEDEDFEAMPDEDSFEEELDSFEEEISDEEVDFSDEELQKELEDLENENIDFSDLDDIDSEEGEEEYYEQESFEEFSDDNVLDSVFGAEESGDGTTGGFDPQPAAAPKELTAKQKAANQYASAYANSGNDKGKFARIVIIGTIVILVVATALWFAYDGGSEKKEIAKKETPKPTPPVEETPKEEPVVQQPEPKKPEKATPTRVAAGTVTQLEARTGKAYVIIASFVDGDLALDHANKLATDGKSPYVIPPFNNGLYYRVAIAEFNSFADASQNIAQYKGDYGQDIWTLRY